MAKAPTDLRRSALGRAKVRATFALSTAWYPTLTCAPPHPGIGTERRSRHQKRAPTDTTRRLALLASVRTMRVQIAGPVQRTLLIAGTIRFVDVRGRAACPANTYSISGNATCTACPAGTSTNSLTGQGPASVCAGNGRRACGAWKHTGAHVSPELAVLPWHDSMRGWDVQCLRWQLYR